MQSSSSIPSTSTLNRRAFLKNTGLTGLALVLGIAHSEEADAAVTQIYSGDIPAGGLTGEPLTGNITPYISIEPSGRITIFNPKPEMGQGTWQSIPSLIAEELEVSLEQVNIVTSSGQKGIASQSAGGSSSVRSNYMNLRKVGASARDMLRTAAANTWNVPVGECYAGDGKIIHRPSGKSAGYGELVQAAAGLPVPDQPALKDPKDFRILGKSSPRPDVPLKSTGKAVFGIDMELPGMAYASVERCPVLGSKLVSYDDSAALQVKGVIRTVKSLRIQGKNRDEGVAVIADNYWAALKGRKALKIVWDHQGHDSFNTKDYEQHLRDLAKQEEGLIAHNSGDFDKAFGEAASKVEAFYETPMVAHATMEPMNCLAHWQEGDKIDIYTSVQGAQIVKRELADALGVPQDNISPHIEFLGGGFGRRLSADFASEAALLSKAVSKPVKVIWTREDDIRLGPFRPMTFSALKGGLSADGKVTAFQHRVISPSINGTKNPAFDKTKVDKSMVEGISDQEYEFPNMKNTWVYADIHIPMQPWRSVTSSTVAFAHECFIDELAVAAHQDPLAFRLALLSQPNDTSRVLRKLAEVSGWDKPLPKGQGRGIAQYKFFAGQAGNVVEVSTTKTGGIKIEKIYAVIDLGTVVNPDTVRGQVEGAIIMALVAATKDAVIFEKGQSVQTNFHNNRMLRINETPPIEVHILAEGGSTIKGVGEPGLPPLAPALCNAIYAATGHRIRKLPFDMTKIG